MTRLHRAGPGLSEKEGAGPLMARPHFSCPVCNSVNLFRFNSYKHHCYACGDCNSVAHVKKDGRYLLEYVLPAVLLRKILPRQVCLRLFHAPKEFESAKFYDIYAQACQDENDLRRSEVDQLRDQFALIGVDLAGKSVLDISGGPGFVGKHLSSACKKVVVTECCDEAARAMADTLGINAVKYDYSTDALENLFQEQFDVVLLRSSIIFCPDLDKLVASLRKVIHSEGYVLVESIIPSLGEVFWWQQMEFKFPIIYSQQHIEKCFYKHGFSLRLAYREYGSYLKNKWRGGRSLSHRLFTWLIDFPMMGAYYMLARKSRVPIDQRLHHKMLTQIWRSKNSQGEDGEVFTANYRAGVDSRSTHFSFVYDGYLKRKH